MSRFVPARHSERTMLRKLFGYMMTLAALLLFTVLTGLFLFGHFNSPQKDTVETLQLQMDFFSSEVTSRGEETAVTGLLLSREMTALIEKSLAEWDMNFHDLIDRQSHLSALQDRMIEPLRQLLLQADCSGAFVLLDTTVNSSVTGAEQSKSGLYLQKSDPVSRQSELLLYRGDSGVGKAHGIMPHRKWRLELCTDLFPHYDDYFSESKLPLDFSYHFTDIFTLPGMSERAILMTIPMIGEGGTVYGLCGFEISQSYFQANLAQPSQLPYLTCMVIPQQTGDAIKAESSLSCGVDNGYYLSPSGNLTSAPYRGALSELSGGTIPYVGLLEKVTLTPKNPDFTLAVLIPKAYYEREVLRSDLQFVLLALLLLFFTVTSCIYFSRRFLTPVLRSLDRIKSDNREDIQSGFQEIDDLFGFLAKKDLEHESALQSLREEILDARQQADSVKSAYEQTRSEYEEAQSMLSQLNESYAEEINSEEYQLFLEGIHNLTPTERSIFGYYLNGNSVKEILQIADIKESTLRYHNRNIYSKLGVHSLKQLLQYAALMNRQHMQKDTISSDHT